MWRRAPDAVFAEDTPTPLTAGAVGSMGAALQEDLVELAQRLLASLVPVGRLDAVLFLETAHGGSGLLAVGHCQVGLGGDAMAAWDTSMAPSYRGYRFPREIIA